MLKKFIMITGFILSAALIIPAQTTRRPNLVTGAVYVLTNQKVNSVMAFARNPQTGTLSLIDTEPTGGAGDPIAMNPTDPLASQGAIAVDQANSFIFAVNAGSDEISVLRVQPFSLEYVDKVSTGGVRPVSVAIYNDLLYVLNAAGIPNISGFRISADGFLTPINGSVQTLLGGDMSAAAQVGFNGDGSHLIVTEKAGNRLDVFPVDANGVAGSAVENLSQGMTPFGFAVSQNGTIFVSEAFGGMPDASAVTSYMPAGAGLLNAVSPSVGNKQTASCWVAVTQNGRNLFVSNTGSGNVSSYTIGRFGRLILADPEAATIGADTAPIDIALSPDDRFLYVLEGGEQTIGAFAVGDRGGLTSIGEFGSLPLGSQGIASK